MNKTIGVLIIIVVAAVLLLGLIFLLRGSEDTWLCVNGEWVKHGVPSAPMPTTGCGDEKKQDSTIEITSFEECIKAGNPALESWPRQCRTKDGKSFTEEIGNESELVDMINIEVPRPNETVTSPIQIEGVARGFWFFEASFPIKLVDTKGKEITSGIATTQDEWMTEDFVHFTAELTFEKPEAINGILILERDNPSGLPENDEALSIPVKFE